MKCMSANLRRVVALLALVTPAQALLSQDRPTLPSVLNEGIVVESLTNSGEAKKAGMQTGDLLLSWSGPTSKGEIESPFDLPFIGFEQAARGTVRMEGLRRNEKHTWILRSVPWGIATHPNIADPILSVYLQAEE